MSVSENKVQEVDGVFLELVLLLLEPDLVEIEIAFAFFHIQVIIVVFFLPQLFIKFLSLRFLDRFVKHSLDRSRETLNLNDFAQVSKFRKFVYFVHVSHVDTKLTHVHF